MVRLTRARTFAGGYRARWLLAELSGFPVGYGFALSSESFEMLFAVFIPSSDPTAVFVFADADYAGRVVLGTRAIRAGSPLSWAQLCKLSVAPLDRVGSRLSHASVAETEILGILLAVTDKPDAPAIFCLADIGHGLHAYILRKRTCLGTPLEFAMVFAQTD